MTLDPRDPLRHGVGVARPSERARLPGELTTTEAAERLRVHPRTVARWADAALHGEPSRLAPEHVRRDVVDRLWIRDAGLRNLL